MPYARPTLTQLRQQAVQDVVSGGIPGVVSLLRFSVLYVLSMVLCGLAWLHYGYIDWVSLQSVPWTAQDEFLAGWAALKNVFLKAATAASGPVSFAATGTSIIPAGTQITLTGGYVATTTADSVTTNGVTVANATMAAAGAAGNVPAGTIATLSSPVPGIQTSGTVTASWTGGADIEDQTSFRGRTIAAYQAGGTNGKPVDYVGWATDVAGITRAWCAPNGAGAGTVVLYIMLDKAQAAHGGFPQGTNGASTAEPRYATATGDQLTVADAVSVDQSVTDLVIVCSPIAQPTPFVIADLGTANTEANQEAITEALQDMFTRLSSPKGTWQPPGAPYANGTIHPNMWDEAISALGLPTFSVASPSAPVVGATNGCMPTLGTITFAS
ncbi:baseplate J/gp47 family protein [Gluconacetobacter azotocaptans]|uniref:Baseplate J/gp47 family protein n=1 Tax=Gluconacetobacter azotocaptans TaxID=142834 RepID=A0A7W4JQU0_9PROT|nr:baseplate J/gp47 family protein [Gluconacetobacter azotocaptans]MBB2189221.1 baseplate J/gp47 family protein [Gluconacetobacter azotocaptans]GBQ32306.1 bacteriophage protein [Gluconacetobacter azotocaptans DSM 13594]